MDVQRAGFSRSATVDKDPVTLSQARVESLELRATYREAMALQLSTTQNAGAGPVQLGDRRVRLTRVDIGGDSDAA